MRFINYISLCVITICMVISYSCSKDSSCFKSSGNEVVEERVVKGFDKVSLSNQINLHLKQGFEFKLELKGGDNLLPKIVTKVEDGTLVIESGNKCRFLRDYDNFVDVYLTVPNLTKIDYSGQGDIGSINTLNFPDLTVSSDHGTGKIDLEVNSTNINFQQHTGPADFILRGISNNTYIYTKGNGWVYFNDLNSDNVHVSSNGTGDVFVKAIQNLRIELRYIGNIYYYGNPTLNVTEHSGTGKIIKN